MKTQLKVGLFTMLGIIMVMGMTVYVNDKPFWWRKCQPIYVNIDDATGLKSKSPVRSLGLEIGYLRSVELSETYVRLGVCITAPVQVLPATRAYIRAEGFLGDKFLELRPIRYVGTMDSRPVKRTIMPASALVVPTASPSVVPSGALPETKPISKHSKKVSWLPMFWDALFANAWAESEALGQTGVANSDSKDIPVGDKAGDVQAVVDRVNGLVKEMTNLTTNLKDAINPDELRQTMRQLNKTLENASKTLSPEGGLNTTAQRTLSKLEDAIEQLRDIISRINRGEGSIGKVINDPSYADELKEAIKNVNRLLNRVGQIRLRVDVFAEDIPAFNGARGGGRLSIWPARDRYYLLGLAVDPRGQRTVLITKTTVGGKAGPAVEYEQLDTTTYVLTAMLGKVFWNRLDVSAGALHSDGVVSVAGWLGPVEKEDMFKLKLDAYSRGQGANFNMRISGIAFPLYSIPGFSGFYVNAGLESIYKVNDRTAILFGAGLAFDDDDIRMLLAFR